MMRTLLFAPLVLLALASVASAGPASVEAGVVDDLLDTLAQAGESVGDAVGDAGDGVGDATSAVGDFLGRAIAAVGQAAALLFGGLASAGLWTSVGLAGAVGVLAQSISWASVSLGQSAALLLATLGTAIVAISSAIYSSVGTALQFFGGLVAALLGPLRPVGVPRMVWIGGVSVAAAATVGTAIWPTLRRILRGIGSFAGIGGIAGFSRIATDNLLEHPVRRRLVETIGENPGIHASELQRRMDAAWGTLTHHLTKLERARLVTSRLARNQKCYFAQGGTIQRHDMDVASILRGEMASKLADFVSHHPMSSQKEAARRLGISPALVSFHVKKLLEAGAVDVIPRGKERLLLATDAFRRVYAPVPVAPSRAVAAIANA